MPLKKPSSSEQSDFPSTGPSDSTPKRASIAEKKLTRVLKKIRSLYYDCWFSRAIGIIFMFLVNIFVSVRAHTFVSSFRAHTVTSERIGYVWKSFSNFRSFRSPLNLRSRVKNLLWNLSRKNNELQLNNYRLIDNFHVSSRIPNEFDFPTFIKSIESFLVLDDERQVEQDYTLVDASERENFLINESSQCFSTYDGALSIPNADVQDDSDSCCGPGLDLDAFWGIGDSENVLNYAHETKATSDSISKIGQDNAFIQLPEAIEVSKPYVFVVEDSNVMEERVLERNMPSSGKLRVCVLYMHACMYK